MTRPKVDPDKRQRTACACDSCKRRKQKCNGENPCNTCVKRHLPCVYTPVPSVSETTQDDMESPSKRRHIEMSPSSLHSSPEDEIYTFGAAQPRIPNLGRWNTDGLISTSRPFSKPSPPAGRTVLAGLPQHSSDHDDDDSDCGMSSLSGPADEAEVYPAQKMERMLQDSTGRLLYVGDSATLSYLQLIRMIVEGIAGPSKFTTDPRRHMIMEARIEPPPSNALSGVLPDRRTADVLVTSYFTNTIGFVEVFDRDVFMNQLEQCYRDPLSVDPSVLCQLHLVFAIGLILARPTPGEEDDNIIRKLRANKDVNRAELFFRNAKNLADPVSGFEDADFWSVQALLLMALYMLSVSKRNAAYAYYGMAVRSAFALGLHREESMLLFSEVERKVRRNLWRTLFVLDRFLAAALGRPTAISEEDCSEHALDAPSNSSSPTTASLRDEINTRALDATVKTCHSIGIILKKIYARRKISISVAQDIADQLESWNASLDPSLHWRQASDGLRSRSHGIAILHTNILHCHAIILLTRPFFLYILNKAREHLTGARQHRSRVNSLIYVFSLSRLLAALHTLAISLVALDAGYLPQCNPFVIHSVFAAGLVVLSNEFAGLYRNLDAEIAIQQCISILKYCAELDAQARRVIFIVEAFNDANTTQSTMTGRLVLPGRKISTLQAYSTNPLLDRTTQFFKNTKTSPKQEFSPLASQDKPHHHSLPAGIPSSVTSGASSMLQQPSPDATETSPVNHSIALVAGFDTPLTHETEFDFDSFWPPFSAPSGGMPIAHPIDSAEVFSNYELATSHVPIGTVLAANMNVPLYPAAAFR